MKKIGCTDIVFHEHHLQEAEVSKAGKQFIYLLKIPFRPFVHANKKENRLRERTHKSSADSYRRKMTCSFERILSESAAELEVITYMWQTLRTSLNFDHITETVYKNVILMQACSDEAKVRMEKIASAFLIKIQALACSESVGKFELPKNSNKTNRFRIDFSCIIIEEAGSFVLCPERGSTTCMARKDCCQFVDPCASTYAHFIKKLPKWKSISLMPDPDSFFNNIAQQYEISSSGNKAGSHNALQVIFIFYVYSSKSKELNAVVSITDIHKSLLKSSEMLLQCVHAMQSNPQDPFHHLCSSGALSAKAELPSITKRTNIVSNLLKMCKDFFTLKKHIPSRHDPHSSSFAFLPWYLTTSQNSQTFVVPNIDSNADLSVEGTVVTFDLDCGASYHHNTWLQRPLVKLVPIDYRPSVRYQIEKRSKCEKASPKSRWKYRLTLRNHCLAETIRHKKSKKAESILKKTSTTLLVENLKITKQSAIRIIHFLRQLQSHMLEDEGLRYGNRACSTQLVLDEPSSDFSNVRKNVTLAPYDVAHEVNDLKAHVSYLKRKLEEHELRENIISEKEAAIEQWESRRATLNHSVEELVSLLNTNDHFGSSVQKGRLSIGSHATDGSAQAWRKHGLFETTPPLRDDRTYSLAGLETSETVGFNEESSQQSTPLSFHESNDNHRITRDFATTDRLRYNMHTPGTLSGEWSVAPEFHHMETNTNYQQIDRWTNQKLSKDPDSAHPGEECRFLRAKVDILKSYTAQLESQLMNFRTSSPAQPIEQESSSRAHTKRMLLEAEVDGNIPSYLSNGVHKLHKYTSFLVRSCRRVMKISEEVQASIQEKIVVEIDTKSTMDTRDVKAFDEQSKAARKERFLKLGDSARALNGDAAKTSSDQLGYVRNLREQIKNLLQKLSSKEKDNAQWRNRVQKLSRELHISSNKEVNLRNQLDSVIQRNQLLTKDYNVFKKNLRKVDRETEKIQNQNQILKNQLEKIERDRKHVSLPSSKKESFSNFQSTTSRRTELTISKVDSLNSRYSSDEHSNSTLPSTFTFEEQSLCSLTLSQTSSVLPRSNISVPKLLLDQVKSTKYTE